MTIEDYIKENKSLKRKLKVMDQTLLQFGTIKTNYDNLIKKLEEKDSYLKELNLKLEDLVKERTNELENINNKLQMNLKMLEELSTTDSLTGLRNRRSFDEVYPSELDRAKRQGYEFNFLIIDIDYFKKYNDTYGHDKGDEVLQAVGKILNKFSRRSDDFSFRYGGEEFAYISCFQDEESFLGLITSIQNSIENEQIKHDKSTWGYITVSIGAVLSRSKTITKKEIFKITDENLYKSKQEGRNKVTLSVIE